MPRRATFDSEYYERFYGDDPVHTRGKVAHLASAVHSLAQWWDIPVRSVLDIGAGPGYWRDWYAANQPGVDYVSTDVSEHACAEYGHDLRDITKWRPSRRFDLVVCHGVLHYLDAKGAEAAIETSRLPRTACCTWRHRRHRTSTTSWTRTRPTCR